MATYCPKCRFLHLAFKRFYQPRNLLTMVSKNGNHEKMHFSPRSIRIQAKLPHIRDAGLQEASLPPNKSCLLAFTPLCRPLLVSELVLWSRKYVSSAVTSKVKSLETSPFMHGSLSTLTLGMFLFRIQLSGCESPGYTERPHADTPGNSPHQVPAHEWASTDVQPSWAFRCLLPQSPTDHRKSRPPTEGRPPEPSYSLNR